MELSCGHKTWVRDQPVLSAFSLGHKLKGVPLWMTSYVWAPISGKAITSQMYAPSVFAIFFSIWYFAGLTRSEHRIDVWCILDQPFVTLEPSGKHTDDYTARMRKIQP